MRRIFRRGFFCKGWKTELELFSSKAENKDVLQQLVDKFNETHEDVTIKITAPADAGTVLKTRMAKNDMPDIVAMGGDNNYTEVESAGMLVDLSERGLHFQYSGILPSDGI